MTKAHWKKAGFTIAEMSVVLVLGSMLYVGAIQGYNGLNGHVSSLYDLQATTLGMTQEEIMNEIQ
ncbi:MAG: prepilin-type N-terminal cleavage/methylation domain-containing protein [Desulfovibrio sp.]